MNKRLCSNIFPRRFSTYQYNLHIRIKTIDNHLRRPSGSIGSQYINSRQVKIGTGLDKLRIECQILICFHAFITVSQ